MFTTSISVPRCFGASGGNDEGVLAQIFWLSLFLTVVESWPEVPFVVGGKEVRAELLSW